MNVEAFVFDGPPRDDATPALKMAAKRYTKSSSQQELRGLTLLFTHCIGAHKEQWEPVIERLFDTQQTKHETIRVREAWSFDWQSHGDSAVLNREALKRRPEGVSAYEWSSALTAFVTSPRMQGHRIVPLGHSAGAAAVLLTTKHLPHPYPYPALILIEPTLITRELFNAYREDRMAEMDFAVSATSARRHTWGSKELAYAYFRKRVPWEFWDERVVRLLVEYGLEDSSEGSGAVTLKCDRRHEAASYPDVEPHYEGALQLGRVCHALPIHLVWGTRNDLVHEFIQDSLSDPSQGRIVASVSRIKDAGHMVVQEQPDLLASAIIDILDGLGSGPGPGVGRSVRRAKL
ncbi:hypothetical protein GALMADRAFT_235372 [Galerina marginata CBS 339.88]|uniref:AB hydrolase-1 domain-containing protein n=1 Tax=Galerina marginata (strain CBS 339.88) TaxID=685588 RepID=A0A067TUW1_GALM3|nr:hypothetical protein GALMADRAFT_235372 [Galerina marginata CBS 339.88]